MIRSIEILVVIATILLSRPIRAENQQELEKAAKKVCLAGDPWKGAEILAKLFIDSGDITHIFNQARCFEQNGLYVDAIGRFREYLLKGESYLATEEKEVAQKHVELCKLYLIKNEKQKTNLPSAAPASTTMVFAGPRTTTQPASEKLEAIGQHPKVDSTAHSGLRFTGIVVGALGVATVVSGAILNIKANSIASDLEKPNNFYRSRDSLRNNYETLSWVGYGVGAACLMGGVILYILGWRAGDHPPSAITFAPSIGPHMAGGILKRGF